MKHYSGVQFRVQVPLMLVPWLSLRIGREQRRGNYEPSKLQGVLKPRSEQSQGAHSEERSW